MRKGAAESAENSLLPKFGEKNSLFLAIALYKSHIKRFIFGKKVCFSRIQGRESSAPPRYQMATPLIQYISFAVRNVVPNLEQYELLPLQYCLFAIDIDPYQPIKPVESVLNVFSKLSDAPLQ